MNSPLTGLILGAIFGSCLVLSGLTNPDKIIGALRLKDFHAIRTLIVFVLVGILGTSLLELLGVANVNIKSADILPVLIGGFFLGTGLGLTGLCPSTGLAGAASGRIDALTAVVGMLFGAHVYILIYPSMVIPLENIANFGNVTIPQITGTTPTPWIISVFTAGVLTLFLIRPKRPEAVRHGKVDESRIGKALSALPNLQSLSRHISPFIEKDCFESAKVCRRWKNFFFLVMMVSLLILQISFWLVYIGYIETEKVTNSNVAIVLGNEGNQVVPVEQEKTMETNYSTTDDLAPPTNLSWMSRLTDFNMTIEHVTLLIHHANITLVLSSVLYTLTIFFCLTFSFTGGLGGLGHMSRAFCLSLVVLVLLLPWQTLFGSTVLGVIYTIPELIGSCTAEGSGIFDTAILYLRYTGYWTLAVLLLFLAQFHSFRWKRAIKDKKKTGQ